MRLGSLNVRGLGDSEKAELVIAWLKEAKLDIVVLCESYITEGLRALYAQRWSRYQWFTNGSTINMVGITVLVLNPKRV